MRTSFGRGNVRPSSRASTRCSEATDSGPSSSRCTRRSRERLARSDGSGSSDRTERTALTGPATRRSANSSTAADGASSQCRSSTARTTSASFDSTPSSERSAVPTRRRSGGRRGSARSNATSSADRCRAGIDSKAGSGTVASRSASPANVSPASDSAGRAASMTEPPERALSTIHVHTVVFPIPASPTRASAVR